MKIPSLINPGDGYRLVRYTLYEPYRESMFKYSEQSQINLSTCHPELRRLFYRVLLFRDHSILCGHRNQEDQDMAYAMGNSKLRWPESKHNTSPSIGIDVAPYPAPTGSRKMWEWANWVGFVQGVAAELGIKVRNGMDWDQDLDLDDTNFLDAYHWELLEPPALPSVDIDDHEVPLDTVPH